MPVRVPPTPQDGRGPRWPAGSAVALGRIPRAHRRARRAAPRRSQAGCRRGLEPAGRRAPRACRRASSGSASGVPSRSSGALRITSGAPAHVAHHHLQLALRDPSERPGHRGDVRAGVAHAARQRRRQRRRTNTRTIAPIRMGSTRLSTGTPAVSSRSIGSAARTRPCAPRWRRSATPPPRPRRSRRRPTAPQSPEVRESPGSGVAGVVALAGAGRSVLTAVDPASTFVSRFETNCLSSLSPTSASARGRTGRPCR